MPRTRARFQQADIARALRAMQAVAGSAHVVLRADGTLAIVPGREPAAHVESGDRPAAPVEPIEEIVL
jgi:hypothetical protein